MQMTGHKDIATHRKYRQLLLTNVKKAAKKFERVTTPRAKTTTIRLQGKPQASNAEGKATRKPLRNGAQERIRTSTTLRSLDPESSASASSATWALLGTN